MIQSKGKLGDGDGGGIDSNRIQCVESNSKIKATAAAASATVLSVDVHGYDPATLVGGVDRLH